MSRLSHLTWHVFSHLTSNTATCYRSWWMQPSPLPHVSPSHTVACQRCERGRPHRRCPPHTTDGPGVAHSSLASPRVVCVRKRLDRVLAPILAITQKEEKLQTRWRATEESHWRSDIVTDLHICRFCGVFSQTWPFFLSIPPASANRNAKYVCALVCAKGARLIVADKLSRLFFPY